MRLFPPTLAASILAVLETGEFEFEDLRAAVAIRRRRALPQPLKLLCNVSPRRLRIATYRLERQGRISSRLGGHVWIRDVGGRVARREVFYRLKRETMPPTGQGTIPAVVVLALLLAACATPSRATVTPLSATWTWTGAPCGEMR